MIRRNYILLIKTQGHWNQTQIFYMYDMRVGWGARKRRKVASEEAFKVFVSGTRVTSGSGVIRLVVRVFLVLILNLEEYKVPRNGDWRRLVNPVATRRRELFLCIWTFTRLHGTKTVGMLTFVLIASMFCMFENIILPLCVWGWVRIKLVLGARCSCFLHVCIYLACEFIYIV